MLGFGDASAVCVSGYGCTDPNTAQQVVANETNSSNLSVGGFVGWWEGLSTESKILIVAALLVAGYMLVSKKGRR